MDREFKARAIEALQSGRYEKTTECLRDKTGFCVLGVFCDLIDPEMWIEKHGLYYYRGHESDMPSIDQATIDLTENEAQKLMDMNDEGYSFLEIAKWIKENL